MLKVVLDTNIFISGVIWGGVPGEVVDAWAAKKIEVVVSTEIINEIDKILKKLNLPDVKVERFKSQLFSNAIIVKPQIIIDLIEKDPADNKFLECAVESQADFIVSGDKHLLDLKEIHEIKIITARELLKHI